MRCVIASVEHPLKSNPIVQFADCRANFADSCTLRFKAKAAVGHHIVIFASSAYANAGLSAPAGYTSGIAIPAPMEQLVASKFVERAADAVQDVTIKAATKGYYKVIAVEIQGLPPAGYVDVSSPLVDERSVTNYAIQLSPRASSIAFTMHHSQKHPINPAEGWTVVDKVVDPDFGDVLLVQYKALNGGSPVMVKGGGSPGIAQNIASVAISYKRQ